MADEGKLICFYTLQCGVKGVMSTKQGGAGALNVNHSKVYPWISRVEWRNYSHSASSISAFFRRVAASFRPQLRVPCHYGDSEPMWYPAALHLGYTHERRTSSSSTESRLSVIYMWRECGIIYGLVDSNHMGRIWRREAGCSSGSCMS
jgi:hypothetical protein